MRVLLVRLSALGDIVHAWPLATAIKELEPRAHLTWVVEEPLKPIVDGHPAVDAVLTTRTRAWRRRPFAAATRAEIAVLRSRLHELQPELAIDPQGTLKSAAVSHASGAPRRIGLARPWRRELLAGLAYTGTVAGAPAGSHVAATNLELLRALGGVPPPLAPPDGSWLAGRAADRRPRGAWSEGPYAVLLPGAGGVHKILDEAPLASVARGLAELGLVVVVAWGPGERDRAARVAATAAAELAPPTDLVELAALLAGAALAVGGDTGPVHLAASFGVPTVAVFLASDPRRNGPLGPATAVVSGAGEVGAAPTASARAPRVRAVEADGIVAAARRLLAR